MSRPARLRLLLFALYLTFLGGSVYYANVFPVRVLHHALMTTVLAGWLIVRLRRGAGLPATPLNPALYAAVGVWFIAAVTALDPRMSLEHVWFQLMHALVFLALADLFQRGQGRAVIEAQFFLAALVVLMSALEVASWYFGLGLVPGTSVGWAAVGGVPLVPPRLTLALSVSTLLAGYAAPLVTLTGAWALTAARPYRRALWLLCGGLLLVLIFTFSRGGLLSLIAAVAVVAVLHPAAWRAVRRRVSPFVLGLAGLALVVVLVGGIAFISTQPTRVLGDVERVAMWRAALAMTSDDPLTGVGVGQFGRAFRIYRDESVIQDKLATAHNLYLNTLAETGVAGALVGAALLIAFGRGWLQQWRTAPDVGKRLRLAAVVGALAGLAVHSLIDTFTITPLVLLVAVLGAYSLYGLRTRQSAPIAPAHPATGWAALALVVGFGVWFIPMDVAQARFHQSQRGDLSAAHAAAALDPALTLYRLQTAALLGERASTPEAIDAARAAYTEALALEPTWDTGWLNLAALAERQGDLPSALAALDRARRISPLNSAALHWARIAEAANAPDEHAILDAYTDALAFDSGSSAFWEATPLRRRALADHAAVTIPERAYRLWERIDPARAAALVPSAPASASDWRIAARAARSADDARSAWSQALALAPLAGDAYLERARLLAGRDPTAAAHDLRLAALLGVPDYAVSGVRAALATTPDERRRWQAGALPPLVYLGEFAAVLYDRPATFSVLPEMRAVGAPPETLAPLYALAEDYAAAGQTDDARRVYTALLEVFPYEAAARERLAALPAAD